MSYLKTIKFWGCEQECGITKCQVLVQYIHKCYVCLYEVGGDYILDQIQCFMKELNSFSIECMSQLVKNLSHPRNESHTPLT